MSSWRDRLLNARDAITEPFRLGPDVSLAERSWFGVAAALARPVILLLIVLYVATLVWRFSFIRGYDLAYPQAVLTPTLAMTVSGEETTPESGTEGVRSCAPSQTVAMSSYLIDFLVNQNDWAPGAAQYKIGWFGLARFDDGPFFDNKANFQIGVLRATRRIAIELTDLLGRVRGTSGEDPDLAAARSRLQKEIDRWRFNPFDERLPFGPTTPAHVEYRGAIDLFERYNERLARCDALFDARADNLQQLLDRVAKDVGATVDQLAKRSQGSRYDPRLDRFVDGAGNDWGWFDFKADDLFYRASGEMYAYHGLLQAARLDFADVVRKRDLDDVWDRMETHVAHAAALAPWAVSNGREDGAFMPDHLAVIAQSLLRARANMVELRDVLRR